MNNMNDIDKSQDQLDLLRTTAEIPQANSIQLFIRLLSFVGADTSTFEELAVELLVDARTARYYVEFARWLKFATIPDKGVIKLTDIGRIFAKNIDMRPRLFSDAIFSRSLVQDIQRVKRETGDPDSKRAAIQAIAKRSELSDATVKRRASGISTMLEIAYKPKCIDWVSGEPIVSEEGTFEYDGRAFLTAMAARAFGGLGDLSIGFPRQVKAFVVDQDFEMSEKKWRSATHEVEGSPWFGNVPINDSTIATVKRGGPDLRTLVTTTCPFITLAISMLSLTDHNRPVFTWSVDMYGIRVWCRGEDVGTPIEVIEKFCEQNSIKIIDRDDGALSMHGTDQDLLDILVHVGLIKVKDTKVILSDSFGFESRNASEESSSTHDRLIILDDLWEGNVGPGSTSVK